MANTCSSGCFSSQGSPFSSGAPLRARPQAHGAKQVVTVRQYDTLWSIAQRHYGGDVRDAIWRIERENHLRERRRARRTDARAALAAAVDPPLPAAVRDNRRVDLDLVFLGTSGSAPTASRAPAALLVRRGGDRLLFDCGEGTQRQLMRSTVGLPDLEEIFITHYHGDHYLGLPGMLKTFQLRQREVPLTVYGPPGLRDLFSGLAARVREALLRARARRGAAGRGARARRVPHPRLPGRPRHVGRRLRGRRARAARVGSTTRRRTRSGSRSGPSGARCSTASRSRSPTAACSRRTR